MEMPAAENSKDCLGPINVKSVIPRSRQELLKWNGWGYKDSKFVVEVKNGRIYLVFTGNRYPIAGLPLPYFADWILRRLDVDVSLGPTRSCRPVPHDSDYPPPNISEAVLGAIASLDVPHSTDVVDRVVRAHGQTLHDVYTLSFSSFERIPDVVVWPRCHGDVVRVVELAHREGIVVIPFGGGTAVSGAVECPRAETRSIISLDTSQMNRILWLDRGNLVACCESGIVGQDLERELGRLGYTTGHEPDSYEFSSLGGWVATRASGMKKNIYGNIEDLLVHVRMVTTRGVLEKNCQVPRMSCGPDFNHLILGSEGSLGVITEVTIKVRPLPALRRYGSLVFPDFESGLSCMREVAKRRWQPASIRLMDNDQFQLATMLKPEVGMLATLSDGFAKFYITKLKRFDVNKMCVMTLLFEGDEDDVRNNEKRLIDLAKSFGGISAGESNGERGYMLTFVIAYIRDLALQYNIVAESFETSVPWDRALATVNNVKRTVADECRKCRITHFLINCRVTQTYDAGCVIYFYLAFNYGDVEDPVGVHERLETKARDEIVASGGSVSHHHGVGKLRRRWYRKTVGDVGVELYLAAKRQLDPRNVFATDNLIQSKL